MRGSEAEYVLGLAARKRDPACPTGYAETSDPGVRRSVAEGMIVAPRGNGSSPEGVEKRAGRGEPGRRGRPPRLLSAGNPPIRAMRTRAGPPMLGARTAPDGRVGTPREYAGG